MYNFDCIDATNKCIEWIKDFFYFFGTGCNAVLGISGGKDSTVCAALCVEALGKDRVIGVLLPNGIQEDIEDAYADGFNRGYEVAKEEKEIKWVE